MNFLFTKKLWEFQFQKSEEINDLKNTDGVYYEEDDEKPSMTSSSCVPQSKSFPKDNPKYNDS